MRAKDVRTPTATRKWALFARNETSMLEYGGGFDFDVRCANSHSNGFDADFRRDSAI